MQMQASHFLAKRLWNQITPRSPDILTYKIGILTPILLVIRIKGFKPLQSILPGT